VPKDGQLRRVKYLNNMIEQDQRFIKKKVRASQCFKSFHTAERTLEGMEAMNMMRKGQVKRLAGRDAQGQARFVASLFQIAAWGKADCSFLRSKIILATLPGGIIAERLFLQHYPNDYPARRETTTQLLPPSFVRKSLPCLPTAHPFSQLVKLIVLKLFPKFATTCQVMPPS
jgi:hypothetical protein